MTTTKENILPPRSDTVEAIYAYHKAKGDAEPKRGYLGASIIGHSCERYLWYTFRQATHENIEGRIYRLFETGDLEEIRLITELRGIGCEIHSFDPETKQQFEVNGFGGHLSGHMDGAGLGFPEAPKTWHVLEFKTHNAKSFRDLEKKRVLKAKPQHYAQMQCYMGLTGMKRAMYLATNKDTDEIYAERVEFDKKFFDGLMERAHRIITSNNIPPRVGSGKPDWYECSWCDAKEICHATQLDDKALATHSESCRQCCFSTPDIEGEGARWTCDKLNKALSPEDQDRACERLLYLPGFFDGHSDPVGHGQDDAGYDYIEYETREPDSSGRIRWRQGGGGGWGESEIRNVSVSTLGNPIVSKAREFGATVASPQSNGNAVERYSDMEACFCSWHGHASEIAVAIKQLYGVDISDPAQVISQDNDLNVIAVEFQGGPDFKCCAVADTGCLKGYIMQERV